MSRGVTATRDGSAVVDASRSFARSLGRSGPGRGTVLIRGFRNASLPRRIADFAKAVARVAGEYERWVHKKSSGARVRCGLFTRRLEALHAPPPQGRSCPVTRGALSRTNMDAAMSKRIGLPHMKQWPGRSRDSS